MQYFDTLIHSGHNVNWPRNNTNINILNILNIIDNSVELLGAIVQDSPFFDQEHNFKNFVNCINQYKGSKKVYCCISLPKRLSVDNYIDYIKEAQKLDVQIFKIHPRFIDLKEIDLLNILEYMINQNLSIQICTYGYTNNGNQIYLHKDEFWEKFIKLAKNARRNSIMLMHMGGTDLMKVHNYIRHSAAFIGDLSMTYLKYRTSSISDDIGFLLKNFDKRICIGSDFPEYKPSEIINFVKEDSDKLFISKEKIDNFLFENALDFVEP